MLTEYYSAVQIAGAYWPSISTCKVQDLTAACAAETLFERWCWTKGNKVRLSLVETLLAVVVIAVHANNLGRFVTHQDLIHQDVCYANPSLNNAMTAVV